MGAFDDKAPITIPDPNDTTAADAFRRKWGWEPHEQILIKGSVTVSDQEYVSNHYVKTGKKGDMETTAGTGRYALLDRMIMDWSLSRNGQRVAVTPANIRQLPANYSNPVLEACDKMAAAMTEEDQEDFLGSANGHTEVSSSLVTLLP